MGKPQMSLLTVTQLENFITKSMFLKSESIVIHEIPNGNWNELQVWYGEGQILIDGLTLRWLHSHLKTHFLYTGEVSADFGYV